MRIYKYILGFSALSIAGCAAFFSVSGIGQLFIGSFLAVVIMAGSLEIGKLVAASYLHRYWNRSSYFLRGYLILGVIVLMLITSMGIFGFLTSAYQETASQLEAENRKIETLRDRKSFLENEIQNYQEQRSQLSSIRSKQTSRLNSITTNDSLNADEVGYLTRQVQDRIREVDTRLDSVRKDLNVAKDSVSSIESRILKIESGSKARKELGPLLYVAREFNTDSDTAVKWFTLAIIFVFDPLAVSLVLAYNNIVYHEENGGNNNDDGLNNGPSGDDNGGGGNDNNDPDNEVKEVTQKLPLNKKEYSEKDVKDKKSSESVQEIEAENIETEEESSDDLLSFSVDIKENASKNENKKEKIDNDENPQNEEEKNSEEENEQKDLSELREEFFEKSDSSSESSEGGLTIDDLMETEEERRDEDDEIEAILEELDKIDEEENVYGENPEGTDKQESSPSEEKIESVSENSSNESKSTKRVDFHSGQKDVKRQ